MKCFHCGFEVEDVGLSSLQQDGTICIAPAAPAGLTVATNGPCDPAAFAAVFGFWNQRSQSRYDICGACLVEALSLVTFDVPART